MPSAAMILQTPPALDPWQAQLADLRIGPGTPLDFSILDGVDELPEIRTTDEDRPWAHGTYPGADYAAGRAIAWTLQLDGQGEALAAALAELRATMVPTAGQALVPLWFNLPRLGRVVRFDVKVRRHRIAVDEQWVRGVNGTAEAQLYAPDPLGYGPGRSESTAFPVLAGGLEFDMFTDGTTDTGFLEFGAAGSTGRLDLGNEGNADSWAVYEVAGPTPAAGFDIVDLQTGRRLRFTGAVPAGSVLAIDTGSGDVVLDGVADRSGSMTIREWTPIPASGGTSIAFLPLGPTTAATLTASWAPAFW